MFREIIEEILKTHHEFHYEELEEICQAYYETIPEKIKQETKLKRVAKYMKGEFEIEEVSSSDFSKENGENYKDYSLDTLPKYLFEGKSKIVSGLINISKLSKSIGAVPLFIDVDLKVNTNDKIALIGKNGAGKTTLLKMILAVK